MISIAWLHPAKLVVICSVCGQRKRIALTRAWMCAGCALAATEANQRWAYRMERGYGDPWL